jgi:hypothetical protein
LDVKILVLTVVWFLGLDGEAGNRHGDAECYREDRTKYDRSKHEFLLGGLEKANFEE